jgi:hypothetical protein
MFVGYAEVIPVKPIAPLQPLRIAARNGCKTLIGSRLKRSGMFWTVRGANAVIAVRCCRHSREFDDYWESRRK